MIPRRFRPNTYEYVRSFVEMEDLEAARLAPNAPEMSEECIICMNPLRQEVDGSLNGTTGQNFANIYMETPCKHKFHKKCLMSWMRIKMECPVCRVPLPPFVED